MENKNLCMYVIIEQTNLLDTYLNIWPYVNRYFDGLVIKHNVIAKT